METPKTSGKKKLWILLCLCAAAAVFAVLCITRVICLAHTWQEATCTEPARCSKCSRTQGRPLGHTVVTDIAMAPTCTEAGFSAGSHCSVCGAVLAEQEVIPPLGHTEITDAPRAASCTEPGLTEGRHCSVCAAVLIPQKEISAPGHTEVIDEAIAPTCTEPGLTAGSHCAVCGEVLTAQQEIPATGHTEAMDEAVMPTCTEPGLTAGTHCAVCGEVLTAQQEIPAAGHVPKTDEAVAPTCTEPGLTAGSHCAVCKEVLIPQKAIPAPGHTPVTDQALAPTCTASGLTAGSHCTVCGAVLTEQQEVPALGHTEATEPGLAPTCTEPGLTDGTYCAVCGEVITAQREIPATGHTEMIDPGYPATYTETGLSDGSHCAVCGEVLVAQEQIPVKINFSAASMTEVENADGLACVRLTFYLMPGETMTAVLPHQDDMVYTNDSDACLDISLDIPKDCYRPNTPLESAEYTVTPLVTVTSTDGSVRNVRVGSFTMTFPEAVLELTVPTDIPAEGVMCGEGNVLRIEGKTNDHTLSVTANGQKLNVYAEGAFKGEYVLSGDLPELVTITASGNNYVTCTRTITVLPYVSVIEPTELSVDGIAKDRKADLKSGTVQLTGKVTPGSAITAVCDNRNVTCGTVEIGEDGSFALEVRIGTDTYGLFAVELTATQEGHEEKKVTAYVYRMYADRKAFINNYSKAKMYYEVPNKKISFEQILADPAPNVSYRFSGSIEDVTEKGGFTVVTMNVTAGTNKEKQTVRVIDLNQSGYVFDQNIGNTCKIYCTPAGLCEDGSTLLLLCWFAQK